LRFNDAIQEEAEEGREILSKGLSFALATYYYDRNMIIRKMTNGANAE